MHVFIAAGNSPSSNRFFCFTLFANRFFFFFLILEKPFCLFADLTEFRYSPVQFWSDTRCFLGNRSASLGEFRSLPESASFSRVLGIFAMFLRFVDRAYCVHILLIKTCVFITGRTKFFNK